MNAVFALLASLLPRLIEKLAEPSTKTGGAGLALNGALAATTNPDPVQLALQIVLALLQLYDIFRRERAGTPPPGPQ